MSRFVAMTDRNMARCSLICCSPIEGREKRDLLLFLVISTQKIRQLGRRSEGAKIWREPPDQPWSKQGPCLHFSSHVNRTPVMRKNKMTTNGKLCLSQPSTIELESTCTTLGPSPFQELSGRPKQPQPCTCNWAFQFPLLIILPRLSPQVAASCSSCSHIEPSSLLPERASHHFHTSDRSGRRNRERLVAASLASLAKYFHKHTQQIVQYENGEHSNDPKSIEIQACQVGRVCVRLK